MCTDNLKDAVISNMRVMMGGDTSVHFTKPDGISSLKTVVFIVTARECQISLFIYIAVDSNVQSKNKFLYPLLFCILHWFRCLDKVQNIYNIKECHLVLNVWCTTAFTTVL